MTAFRRRLEDGNKDENWIKEISKNPIAVATYTFVITYVSMKLENKPSGLTAILALLTENKW